MELLVRIVDKRIPPGYNPVKAAKATTRGDVIAVQPDGFAWGARELDNPEWAIVRTNISQAEAEALMVIEPGDDATNRMLRKRAFYLDCNALGISYIGSRLERINKSPSAVRIAKRQKEPLVDPSIINPVPLVIG